MQNCELLFGGTSVAFFVILRFCLIGEGELEKIESLDVKISLELSQAGTSLRLLHFNMPWYDVPDLWNACGQPQIVRVEEKMRQYEKDCASFLDRVFKRMGDWTCLYLVVRDRSNERPDHTWHAFTCLFGGWWGHMAPSFTFFYSAWNWTEVLSAM